MRETRRWLVVAAAITGLLTRWWVLSTNWGGLNADEAVTGLGAIDALHGRFDVVIPGNAYTANLESYLFAPVVGVFGAHVTPLKLLPVVLWAVASCALVRVIRPVVGRAAGVLAGVLLWLVPGALLVLSTRAYLAYAGGLCLVTLALGFLVIVIESDVPSPRQSAVSGLLAGLAVFAHPMYLAVLAPAALIVGSRHRKCFRYWWLPFAGMALMVNFPWIVWNVRHDFPSLASEVVDDARGTYAVRLGRFFAGLLPRDFGLLDLGGTRWTFGRPASVVIYALVLGVVVIGAVRLARSGRGGRLLAICLLVVWPVMAVFSPLGFVLDGRYGIVPAPLLIGAFAAGSVDLAERLTLRRHAGAGVVTLTVVMWMAVLVVPYQWKVVGHQRLDPNAAQSTLLSFLKSHDVRFVAGSYWAVLPITYMSDARIPSAVTAGFPIRYPHYQRLVEGADPHQVAFVYQPSDDNPSALRLPADGYERSEVAGFIVYVPR